jgi:hypothetical protein
MSIALALLIGAGSAVEGRGDKSHQEEALSAHDRATEAGRKLKKREFMTETKTMGSLQVNPLIKVERENRQLFARLWPNLSLIRAAEIGGGISMPPFPVMNRFPDRHSESLTDKSRRTSHNPHIDL